MMRQPLLPFLSGLEMGDVDAGLGVARRQSLGEQRHLVEVAARIGDEGLLVACGLRGSAVRRLRLRDARYLQRERNYAAFVLDPDGNNIEAVCRNE